MPDALIRLHPEDTVAITTRDVEAGEELELPGGSGRLSALQRIPRGHKVALCEVAAGSPVLKYGSLIGLATAAIAPGEHVHVQNLAMAGPDGRHAETRIVPEPPGSEPPEYFEGIVRADGQVATRNYLGVIASVNCSASVARFTAQALRASGALESAERVDGVVALTHGSGCGLGQGEGLDLLRRTLTGYARHPNFAGLLVIGLGCEVNQVGPLVEGFELPEGKPVRAMTIQESGGTSATVREGVEHLVAMLPEADAVRRVPVPASRLVLGLQCGGSDAWSGVTANPALGAAVDILVRQGGTAVLGETPEIYGAEHLLTSRAASPEVAEALMERIRWWERYTELHGGSMDNNPSPGNKEGGLTTILEKALGAAAKGGARSMFTGVCGYAEAVSGPGLVFMDTPGYDPVSVTGMVAGGANVVCFTTGRGSVFGSRPAPCLKLATNTEMYLRMAEDMDINCGEVLDGGVTVEEMGRRIFERILALASGELSASEKLAIGDDEIVPWALGAVM